MVTPHVRIAGRLAAAGLLVAVTAGVPAANAQGTYASLTTPRFEFQYDRALSENDVRTQTEFLEENYASIQKELGFEPKMEIRVRLYGSVSKFLAETKLGSPWRGALFVRGILHAQPTQALVQRNILESALAYELALAFLDQSGNDGCPRWLREAYAVHHSGILPDLTTPVGAKLASFSDLEQDLQLHQKPPQLEDVQYILGQTVLFLIDRFGTVKTMGLYRQFDGTRSVETVFRKHMGEEFSSVEKAWAKYISGKTSRVR
jgi:hypothetical protein